MLESYFFIINPNSGRKSDAGDLAEAVKTAFAGKAKAEIAFTVRPGHAQEIAREAAAKGFKAVVVAGGDGTLNETLPALCGTQVALGLVPKGSGNGLAREFDIPLNPRKALEALLSFEPRRIDLGRINGEYYANVAGIGLDALIGKAFNEFGKKGPRGKLPYYYFGVSRLLSYKPPEIELHCEGKVIRTKPLCIAFANCRQFGGGAIIAPSARPDDGLLNIVVAEHKPLYETARYLHKLFTGTIDKVPFVTTIKSASVFVRAEGEIIYQLDGEPRSAQREIRVDIVPAALSILAPKKI